VSRAGLNASAPDFTLADFLGSKNILLVFNRGFF